MAMITTIEKPKCTANKVANTALITEAQPLIPHAQGTRDSSCSDTLLSASGNGIPIQIASGAIKPIETTIFADAVSVARATKSGCKTSKYTALSTTMPNTDKTIALLSP